MLVAQAELNGLGERVHHVPAVVVQNQNVGTGVENRRDVLREVTCASGVRTAATVSQPRRFGVLLDRTFLRPAPVVVGGQVIGLAVIAVGFFSTGARAAPDMSVLKK
jgi:hypothetical protein